MNTTLNGGRSITVAKTETENASFFVRQLPVREMAKYMEAQDDEIALVALCVSAPEAEIEALPLAAQEQLVEACEEVNADFFSRWLARQQKRMERMAPGLLERKMAALSVSPISSPKPPSSAA